MYLMKLITFNEVKLLFSDRIFELLRAISHHGGGQGDPREGRRQDPASQ